VAVQQIWLDKHQYQYNNLSKKKAVNGMSTTVQMPIMYAYMSSSPVHAAI